MFETFLPSLPEDDKNLFKAVILCCGVYDLTPLINTYINQPLKLNEETAKKLSPLYHDIKKIYPVTHIVVGENESPAFQKQSIDYYEKIKNLGKVSFKIIENVDHFSIVENYSRQDYELVQFLLELENK